MSVSADQSKNQPNRFLKNSVALAIGGVVAQVAIILVEIVIARGLGATAYGVFATTYAFTVLAIFLFDLGTTWWTIQEGSRRPERLPSLLGNTLALKSSVFLIIYLATVVVLTVFDVVPDHVRDFVFIFGFYALGLGTIDTIAAVYTARKQMHINAIFQSLSPIVILLAYMLLTRESVSLVDVGIAFGAGSVFVGLVWLFWTARKVGLQFNAAETLGIIRHSYHYGFTGILRQIFYKTDVVMIALLVGAAEAGMYAAAAKFLDLFYKIPVLASRVVLPALFAESSKGANQKFDELVSVFARLLVSIGALAGLITFIAADELVLLVFGSEYAGSVSVLRILSLAMILKCIMAVGENVLSSLSRHTERWAFLATAVSLNIGLNFVLVPAHGGVGAAIATIVSGVALITLYIAFGFGEDRALRAVGWFGLPTAISIALALLAMKLDLHILVSVPIMTVVFLLLLIVSGYVQKKEARSLKMMLSSKRRSSDAT